MKRRLTPGWRAFVQAGRQGDPNARGTLQTTATPGPGPETLLAGKSRDSGAAPGAAGLSGTEAAYSRANPAAKPARNREAGDAGDISAIGEPARPQPPAARLARAAALARGFADRGGRGVQRTAVARTLPAAAISAAIPAAMVVGGSSQQRPQPLFAAAADQPLGSLLLRPALAPASHGRQPQKRPRECGA